MFTSRGQDKLQEIICSRNLIQVIQLGGKYLVCWAVLPIPSFLFFFLFSILSMGVTELGGTGNMKLAPLLTFGPPLAVDSLLPWIHWGQLEKFPDLRAGFNWALFQVSWQGRLWKEASWQNPSVLLTQMDIPRWVKCGRWGLLQSLLRDGGRDYPWSAGWWCWGECHSSLYAILWTSAHIWTT